MKIVYLVRNQIILILLIEPTGILANFFIFYNKYKYKILNEHVFNINSINCHYLETLKKIIYIFSDSFMQPDNHLIKW